MILGLPIIALSLQLISYGYLRFALMCPLLFLDHRGIVPLKVKCWDPKKLIPTVFPSEIPWGPHKFLTQTFDFRSNPS